MKQLLPVRGKPVIRIGIESLRGAGFDGVTVVVNPEHEEVVREVRNQPVTVAFNESAGSDMAESVRVGLRTVPPASTGVLVHLADYPLVTAHTIRCLLEHHREHPGLILAPSYESRSGHPVLFPRNLIEELATGGTLRDVVARHRSAKRLIPVQDPGVTLDMDTPDDYERIIRLSVLENEETGDVRMPG